MMNHCSWNTIQRITFLMLTFMWVTDQDTCIQLYCLKQFDSWHAVTAYCTHTYTQWWRYGCVHLCMCLFYCCSWHCQLIGCLCVVHCICVVYCIIAWNFGQVNEEEIEEHKVLHNVKSSDFISTVYFVTWLVHSRYLKSHGLSANLHRVPVSVFLR